MFSTSSNRLASSSYPASKTNPSVSGNPRRFSEAAGPDQEGEESQVHLVYSHTSPNNGQDAAANYAEATGTASVGTGTVAQKEEEM